METWQLALIIGCLILLVSVISWFVLRGKKANKDKQTGKSKGFGFVEMTTREEAEAAAAKFNGYEFKNRALVVNIAAPKAPRSLFQS